MGKKMRSKCPSGFQRILKARLEQYAYNHDVSNEDDVLHHLRISFPEYGRLPLQPFRTNVFRALQHVRSGLIRRQSGDQDDDDCCSTPSDKGIDKKTKTAIMEWSEEKLVLREREHLKKRNMTDGDEDEGTSSSDESDFSPGFDLMKSNLRDRYAKLGSVSMEEGPHKLEENLEILCAPKMEERNIEQNCVASEITVPESNVVVSALKKDKKRKKTRDLALPESDMSNSIEEKKKKKGTPNFKDLGGIKGILDELIMEVMFPLFHPHLLEHLGVRPLKGILLHGPPGCGKTKLAHAIANETGVSFYKISATEIVSGISGVSEENIRKLFAKAHKTGPSIVFIDEIDAIGANRDNLQREMERRIVTQLLTCMDELHQPVNSVDHDSDSEASCKKSAYVLVIGATNRPDAVDRALRRPGRFDREILMDVPDESARREILSVLTRNLTLDGSFDLKMIAKLTPGFVAADLAALTNKAGNLAMKRILDKRKLDVSVELSEQERQEDWWKYPWSTEEIQKLRVTMNDFEQAAKVVQPSSKREGFSSIPDKTWDDVGGMHSLRRNFELYIVGRIKHPEDYEEFGMDLETGFLLYGPPGCGKSLIAMAVANEAGANFIHIKGPEILNKYVGESEAAIRKIFWRAATCAPCILFFDEVDALTTKRGEDGGRVVGQLVNQLLMELDDGGHKRKGVYVIGATNRPDAIDRALLRPGRLGKLMFVPLPSVDERTSILQTLSRKRPISPDVNFGDLSLESENFSGADLSKWVEEAAMAAFVEKQNSENRTRPEGYRWLINKSHFEEAKKKVTPSVTEKQRRYYSEISRHFGVD